jgi:hypothetical protein
MDKSWVRRSLKTPAPTRVPTFPQQTTAAAFRDSKPAKIRDFYRFLRRTLFPCLLLTEIVALTKQKQEELKRFEPVSKRSTVGEEMCNAHS